MSKQQMIDAIYKQNPSASPEFLMNFNEGMLKAYLDRLTKLVDHRGRDSRWDRDKSQSWGMAPSA